MRILIILLLLLTLKATAQYNTDSIELPRQIMSLEEILNTIFDQANRSSLYETPWLRCTKPVTLKARKMSFQDLLTASFKEQPLTYEFVDDDLLITFKPITGRIFDDSGRSVEDVSVMLNGISVCKSDDYGRFELIKDACEITLGFSHVSFEYSEKTFTGRPPEQLITLTARQEELPEAKVYSTGYQKIPKERATGSFSHISTQQLNQGVVFNIHSRLADLASGLLYTNNPDANAHKPDILIRGTSTLFADPTPLVVIDNFPQTGPDFDINLVNINDIEKVTILKDAAAASIWGARAGNGVIVITTKKGKYNKRPVVSLNVSVTAGRKPNLYYAPVLGPADYIEMEKYLFDLSFYDALEHNIANLPVSPVVNMLFKKRRGALSPAVADSLISILQQHDARDDLDRHAYQYSLYQQYAINVSGGTNKYNYYLGIGYDRNITNLVNSRYDQVTVNSSYMRRIGKRIEINGGLSIWGSRTKNDDGPPAYPYPYSMLAGNNGTFLPVEADVSQAYKDTAYSGLLLDWNYRPLQELRLRNNNRYFLDIRANAGISLKIMKGTGIQLLYLLNTGYIWQKNHQSQQTYYTRNLINSFSSYNGGSITRPIPLGGIMDLRTGEYSAHNIRAQLTYDTSWENHSIKIIAGIETRSYTSGNTASRLYGYDKASQTSIPVNPLTPYSLLSFPQVSITIPIISPAPAYTDRYISYFANAGYIYKNRYLLSASIRQDASNTLGEAANQMSDPLYSMGIRWDISEENFYKSKWLQDLKFRLTWGCNGNIDKSTSGPSTITIGGANRYGAQPATINNPPNPNLKWESIAMVNAGIDFEVVDKLIEGSIEFYYKSGRDMIGIVPINGTTGFTEINNNTASINGHGIDITIHTQKKINNITWYGTLFFTHSVDKVAEYTSVPLPIHRYLDSRFFNPIKGQHVYAVNSIRWAGLDPLNGDPLGFLGIDTSKAYDAILNSQNVNDLIEHGSSNPLYYGTLLNQITWQQWLVSFRISYKLKYFFRRQTLNYHELFENGSTGHKEFANRWLKPGDETKTSVPSMQYPYSSQRDIFYQYSSIAVEKGDHIRLQEIFSSYTFGVNKFKKKWTDYLELYMFINNIGILWRANDKDIDPDFVTGTPTPLSFSLGLRKTFK